MGWMMDGMDGGQTCNSAERSEILHSSSGPKGKLMPTNMRNEKILCGELSTFGRKHFAANYLVIPKS